MARERLAAPFEKLSRMAGVPVAAASRALGGSHASGNWTLDVQSHADTAPARLPIHRRTLDGYAHALAGAPPPPAGVPLSINDFSLSSGSLVTHGSAAIIGSALRLTQATNGQAGMAVLNQAFPSSLGLSVTFTYHSGGGNGAEGVSFLMLNGDVVSNAASVMPGGRDSALGYSNIGEGGITGGFLGVGFDTYGQYAKTYYAQTSSGIAGSTANYVGVRGQGNGTVGYGWLTGTHYAPGINGTRTVQVNLLKLGSAQAQLQIYLAPSNTGTFTKVIDTVVNQVLPSRFLLGFAGTTGGLNDVHQINAVKVGLPASLSFSPATVRNDATSETNPATLNLGDQFSYTYTLTNRGGLVRLNSSPRCDKWGPAGFRLPRAAATG